MSARLAAGSSTTDAVTTGPGVGVSAVDVAVELPQLNGASNGASSLVERGEDGQLNAQRDAPVGGQAVLEGVMMRGVSNWAVAVRKPTAEQLSDGELSPEEAAKGEIEVS